MSGQPPDTVPDDLTADEYYNLGTWYLQSNKIEHARDALKRVVAMEPGAPVAVNAKKLLGAKVPAQDVPTEVLTRFHKLAWQTIGRPGDAQIEYKKLIDEYPQFEWPYKALAEIHLRNGDLVSAAALLESALTINKDYSPAMTVMAFVHAADMEYGQAADYIHLAMEASPPPLADTGDALGQTELDQLRGLRRSLEILSALDL